MFSKRSSSSESRRRECRFVRGEILLDGSGRAGHSQFPVEAIYDERCVAGENVAEVSGFHVGPALVKKDPAVRSLESCILKDDRGTTARNSDPALGEASAFVEGQHTYVVIVAGLSSSALRSSVALAGLGFAEASATRRPRR